MSAAAHTAAALGAAVCLVTSAALARRIPAPTDEVWFLQVVTRVLHGRRIYSQVFYGAGPLAVWLACVIQRGRPPSLLRLRLLAAAVDAVTVVALLETLALLGAGPATVAAAALAIAGLNAAWPVDNLYGVVSRCGVALAVVPLAASATDPRLALGLASASGVALALALLSKHSVGAPAALVVIPAWAGAAGWHEAVACLVGMVLPGAAAVLGLDRQRVLGACLRRTVLYKRTYLETGRVSPVNAVVDLLRAPAPSRWMDLAAYGVLVAAPPAAVLAVLAEGLDAIAVLPLAACLVASTVPRADAAHVRPAAPLGVTVLAISVPAGLTTAALLGIFVVVGGAGLITSLRAHGAYHPAVDLPVLAGVPTVSPVTPETLVAGELVRRRAGTRVFVLRGDAAQWYLVLGLVNPTAYDYPFASTFGPHGQRHVADRMVPGDIEWCLHHPADAGPLTPHLLEEVVRERMQLVERTAVGDLYRAV